MPDDVKSDRSGSGANRERAATEPQAAVPQLREREKAGTDYPLAKKYDHAGADVTVLYESKRGDFHGLFLRVLRRGDLAGAPLQIDLSSAVGAHDSGEYVHERSYHLMPFEAVALRDALVGATAALHRPAPDVSLDQLARRHQQLAEAGEEVSVAISHVLQLLAKARDGADEIVSTALGRCDRIALDALDAVGESNNWGIGSAASAPRGTVNRARSAIIAAAKRALAEDSAVLDARAHRENAEIAAAFAATPATQRKPPAPLDRHSYRAASMISVVKRLLPMRCAPPNPNEHHAARVLAAWLRDHVAPDAQGLARAALEATGMPSKQAVNYLRRRRRSFAGRRAARTRT